MNEWLDLISKIFAVAAAAFGAFWFAVKLIYKYSARLEELKNQNGQTVVKNIGSNLNNLRNDFTDFRSETKQELKTIKETGEASRLEVREHRVQLAAVLEAQTGIKEDFRSFAKTTRELLARTGERLEKLEHSNIIPMGKNSFMVKGKK